MVQNVTDPRSHPNEQTVAIVEFLRGSNWRIKVFEAVYRGKKEGKSVSEIAKATKLTPKAVLTAGKQLADRVYVIAEKKKGQETFYKKDRFIAVTKAKILRLVSNPKNLKKIPSRYTSSLTKVEVIRVAPKGHKTKEISCDDFKEFAKVKKVKFAPKCGLSETEFKLGCAALLGDTGQHNDWGGEKCDLYTKAYVDGKRRSVAFAFKGPGKKGILTPGKMGKNGDQIQRLFSVPAEVFIVQYHDQIAESVVDQMRAWAKVASINERATVYYGIINGDDSNRLAAAYPKQFVKMAKRKAKRG